MNAYVCVYRQPLRDDDWQKTWDESPGVPGLKKYLRRYKQRFNESKKGVGHFYDWGDDPSFFAAEEFLGDVRKASWGVCRRDVRGKLSRGDFVVFFCARQQEEDEDEWEYYYIGMGTVERILKNRKRIWLKEEYENYRKFYNLLIDSEGCRNEVIRAYHRDYKKRAKSPYVIFSPQRTHFNLINPLHVATFKSKKDIRDGVVLEKWRREDPFVDQIYRLIPRRDGKKKLRTSDQGNDHAHMNLADIIIEKKKRILRREYGVKQIRGELKELANRRKEKRLKRLRRELLKISREIAAR